MLSNDVQDVYGAQSISILDALQLLLASGTHVEGIAAAGVKFFDADDGLLLTS